MNTSKVVVIALPGDTAKRHLPVTGLRGNPSLVNLPDA